MKKKDILAEFRLLYWKLRENLKGSSATRNENNPHFKAAFDFTVEHKIGTWSEKLLRATLATYQRKSNAIALLDNLVVPQQFTGDVYMARGAAEHSNRNFANAVLNYKKAIELPKYDMIGKVWINLANSYYELGDYDLAIDAANRAIESFKNIPNDLGRALITAGNAYRLKKDYSAAISNFQKAIDLDGFENSARARVYLGRVYVDTENFNQAEECFQNVIKSNDESAASFAWFCLGILFLLRKENEKAIECLQSALSTGDEEISGPALLSIGNAYKALKNFDKAKEYFEKSLKFSNYEKHESPWLALGNLYSQLGNLEEAAKCFKRAIDLSSQPNRHHLARISLADIFRRSKKYPEAYEQIDLVISQPDSGRHAMAKYLKGLVDEALAGLKPSPSEEALADTSGGSDDELSDSPERRIIEKLQDSKTERAWTGPVF